jgi:hypothetical protein
VEQARYQKQTNYPNAETQVGQNELRQQRNGTSTEKAQITTHADGSVVLHIHQGAAIQPMRPKRIWRVAERTVIRSIPIGIGKFLLILLDGAAEWM